MFTSHPIKCLVISHKREQNVALTSALGGSSDFDRIEMAFDAMSAVTLAMKMQPDLILIDLELPGIDPIELSVIISRRVTNVRIVGLSSSANSSNVVDFLSLGNADVIDLPANIGAPAVTDQQLRFHLLPRLRGIVAKHYPTASPTDTRPTSARPGIVVIGVSTGGPNALAELIPELPSDLNVPVVIVQHIPDLYVPQLAARLDMRSPLSVGVAEHGQTLTPGSIWIAHGGRHLSLAGNAHSPVFAVNDGPPENSCRPAVDVLFRGAATVFGARTLAIILTGMGSDGTRGANLIVNAGGSVFAQDQESSVVWGMPGSVVNAGLASKVVPLKNMAAAITASCRSTSRPTRSRVAS